VWTIPWSGRFGEGRFGSTSRAASSSGRALHSHCRGVRFKSGVVHVRHRGVAQLGSALASGARGRRFKSGLPDGAGLQPVCWSAGPQPAYDAWCWMHRETKAEEIRCAEYRGRVRDSRRYEAEIRRTTGCSSAEERRPWEPDVARSNRAIPTVRERGTPGPVYGEGSPPGSPPSRKNMGP
jgi:hypothetical protein